MIVIDLSGRKHKINLYPYLQSKREERSSYHLQVRSLLKEVFPTLSVAEEVYIPGEHLYLDFFIPQKRIAVEVHGEQHFSFNNFFYKNNLEFLQAKRRDSVKQEWCELNNIKLIILSYKENEIEWQRKLTDNG